jgi:hypothetical protein
MRVHSGRLQCALLATLMLILGSALAGCGVSTIGASATDVSATSTLTSGPTGTIAGDVVAGPTCPVEQAENPCPPAVVKNRKVDVQTQAGTTVASTTTDANGHFSVAVPPGTYVVHVKIEQGQVGMRQTTPGDVTVIANQTSTVHIELDTGIR